MAGARLYVQQTAPILTTKPLAGINGWLLVFLITMCIRAISCFTVGAKQVLSASHSNMVIGGWVFLVLVPVILVAVSQILQKKKSAVYWALGSMAFDILIGSVEAISTKGTHALTLLQALLYTAFWGSYLLLSVRVKNTLVN
jgi:hypothetical protein